MISIQLLRDHPEIVQESLNRRGDESSIDAILALDRERRTLLTEAEELRARRNAVSKEIGRSKEKPDELVAEMREVGRRIKELEGRLGGIESELRNRLLELPNILSDDVPPGADESANKVIRIEGEKPARDFTVKPHWEIGEALGIVDFERGVKLSGSRFYVLKNDGARLQRALIQWMLDVHSQEHGYGEIYPPFIVKEESVLAAGQLPKFRDNLYHDVEDDVWLVPTAEVPVTNLHRDEILAAGELPISYVAYTPCFRREKMSAGRDVRGMKRGHQFDKVELYKFCRPEESAAELDVLLGHAESICRRLGLHYRIVELCAGDVGFAAQKTYDIEVWAPGCEEWLEVSSCSNVGDFQARRANIRYRPEPAARPEFPHTLNGSGLALPRVMIAVMENYQRDDGGIAVPDVLQPYFGGRDVIS